MSPVDIPASGSPPVTWGYARVSTEGQTVAPQIDALTGSGVDPVRIVSEVVSGAVAARARPVLAGLLDALRPGDTITAVRLDRLGRDPADVLSVARDLNTAGIHVRLLDLGATTGTPAGDLAIGVLAAVAGWERAVLRERTRAGLAAARARGTRLGRPHTLNQHQHAHAVELAAAGHAVREIARRLGCGSTVVYRALSSAEPSGVERRPRSYEADDATRS